MSDAMSFAELAAQHVELLPARTVLSLVRAGTPGEQGSHGSDGASIPGTTMWALFGGYDQSGSTTSSTTSSGIGDASSTTTT
jgi:hypothetical protein